MAENEGPEKGKGRGPAAGLIKRMRASYNRMNNEIADVNTDESEIKIKKRRFRVIVLAGLIFSILMFLVTISISSGGIIPIDHALSSLISAIQKGGQGLNTEELYIYHSRLPRAVAAIGVGAGLAVAGCMYQALIRNPLVDPYITGVSSGAGCFAIAVSAVGALIIPFLGAHSTYLIPIAAIIGGLVAFSITILVSEGAGGSEIGRAHV